MHHLMADAKSHFSIGESMLSPEEIAETAANAGYTAAALCDTMTISGMPDFTKACDKHGVKPIIGVRLRVVETLDKVDKQFTVYPKLYILTDEGFRIVTRLLSLAFEEDHFHRVPRLHFDDVIEALQDAAGHIVYSTGSLYSASRRSDVSAVTKKIGSLLSASHTLSELCPGDSRVWDRQSEVAIELAEDLDLPILLSRPVIYEKEDGHKTLDTLSALISNFKRAGRDEFETVIKDYRVWPPSEVVRGAIVQAKRIKAHSDLDFSRLKSANKVWDQIANDATFKWHQLDVSLPKMAPDENAELWRLAKEGLRWRLTSTVFGDKPDVKSLGKVYTDRLKYEMDVLTGMGFAGYFLLTREIVNWSKENGIIVGPGRGSVGGSLVAYVLGITDVDPIRFGLIFERFINPERLDLPDADLDFMSSRRGEVFQHIRDQYGEEHVAGISNYSTLQSRASIQDLCRVEGVAQEVTKFIPTEGGTAIPLSRAVAEVPEVEKFAKESPDLWSTACDIEGKIRTLSSHAAGVVVAGEPIKNRAVVEIRKGDRITNWDKRTVESMGLVKLDILGLSTLDLIAITLKKIKERHKVDLDLSAIPLDDPEILEAFGKGQTVGVFQFESGGMRKLLKDLAKGSGHLSFDEISAATALYRPGPMESGLMDDFVNIKQGEASEDYEHPSMRAALEETYSVIVYQEQVMRIAQDLSGFTMAEADHLRKAIGKKDLKKMEEMGDKFVQGAEANGMDGAKAAVLWDKIVKFAGYAFNKSHSVEYSLISYQSMYLKVKYPVEFFAGALTILNSDKRPGLIKNAQEMGISVLPPDVNLSTDEFEILDDDTLIAPFSIMSGISARGCDEILSARAGGKFTSAEDFAERVPRRVVNKTVREKLDKVGAFAQIEGQLPSFHVNRRTDQLELVPSIMVGGAIVTRELHRDKPTKESLVEVLEHFRDTEKVCEDAVFVSPRMGRRPRFMVIFDGPGYHDEIAGKFATANIDAVEEALEETGLEISDGYWTGFSKTVKAKGDKGWDPSQLHSFKPLLDREIEILNPQVILCLGSNAARHFDPSLKGPITDHAGKVVYRKATDGLANDINVVIGIAPGMVFFDSTKQALLNEAFQQVADMLE